MCWFLEQDALFTICFFSCCSVIGVCWGKEIKSLKHLCKMAAIYLWVRLCVHLCFWNRLFHVRSNCIQNHIKCDHAWFHRLYDSTVMKSFHCVAHAFWFRTNNQIMVFHCTSILNLTHGESGAFFDVDEQYQYLDKVFQRYTKLHPYGFNVQDNFHQQCYTGHCGRYTFQAFDFFCRVFKV